LRYTSWYEAPWLLVSTTMSSWLALNRSAMPVMVASVAPPIPPYHMATRTGSSAAARASSGHSASSPVLASAAPVVGGSVQATGTSATAAANAAATPRR
jgi:hypothetical protein